MTDIVLLVDGSWSIGRNNFKLIKEFLSNLISPFSIAEDKIRVGRTCSCFLTLGCWCWKGPWSLVPVVMCPSWELLFLWDGVLELLLEAFPIWQQALASSGREKYLHSEQQRCLWAALGRVVMLRHFWDLLPSLTRCSATNALGAVAMLTL